MHEKKLRIIGAVTVGALWAGLTLFTWFHGPQEFSQAERRKLQQFPELSVKTLLDTKFMEKFETYSQDQFPMRDSFREFKSMFSYKVLGQKDNNGIYLTEGHGAKLEYPLNTHSVSGAVEKFNQIYARYLKDTGSKVVFSVVPDKSYYLAQPNGYLSMDYEKLFSSMKEGLPWAEYVDITDLLTADHYYKTDTHWRQETILPVAQRLSGALGAEAPKEEDFRKTALKRPFYGVYYGQAALPMDPETMYILKSDVLDRATVLNKENNKKYPVYDLARENGRDQYDVFLSGSVSLEVIGNPNGPKDKELIVFRDSFGSSLVPLLVQGYSSVTLIDTRYVPSGFLHKFVDFHGQDVLMLYSPMVLNNSAILK